MLNIVKNSLTLVKKRVLFIHALHFAVYQLKGVKNEA
jgi:hypothetical protein